MVFDDLASELRPHVSDAVEELFSAAERHQTHPQDLLLTVLHGTRKEDRKLLLLGPDEIGFAEKEVNDFILWYRRSHTTLQSEFGKRISDDPSAADRAKIALQLEMGIYVRFWESEYGLKRLYQLASLACGLEYNWNLKVPREVRDGSKHSFIREQIRDRVAKHCPLFSSILKICYNSQLRNATAHSQYWLSPRGIHLLNHSENPDAHSPLAMLALDDWYRIFHLTLLLQGETYRHVHHTTAKYSELAKAGDGTLEVRVSGSDGGQNVRRVRLINDWYWAWVYEEPRGSKETAASNPSIR